MVHYRRKIGHIMKPVIIFGAGQFAEVAHYYFTHDAKRKVAAFTLDANHCKENTLLETPIITFETLAQTHDSDDYEIFVAIGSSGTNKARADTLSKVKSQGYQPASFVHSKALISTQAIGEHAFILEHNTIQPYTAIGHNVVIWSGNHIGHHVTVEDHCFITSHVVISGGATIGEYSFLGVNATIRDHTNVGKRNIIGASAVILKDTLDDEVYASQQTALHALKSFELTKI